MRRLKNVKGEYGFWACLEKSWARDSFMCFTNHNVCSATCWDTLRLPRLIFDWFLNVGMCQSPKARVHTWIYPSLNYGIHNPQHTKSSFNDAKCNASGANGTYLSMWVLLSHWLIDSSSAKGIFVLFFGLKCSVVLLLVILLISSIADTNYFTIASSMYYYYTSGTSSNPIPLVVALKYHVSQLSRPQDTFQ